jgi:MFS family permease
MGDGSVKRLVATYLLYEAAASSTFYSAVFFVFYEDRVGLSAALVLGLQSYAIGLRALLDLPFGALADRTSRRACLIGSALGMITGAALLLTWPALAAVWIAETCFAAASALRSGADSALLFDALRSEDRLDEYPRTESRGQAAASLGSGLAAVIGGLLAAEDPRLPYAATALVACLTAFLAFRLPEARIAGRVRGARFLGEARRAVRTRGVPWTLGLAVLTVVASHAYFFLQQPYLRAIGVPVALFGVVFAATKVVTALVASIAHRADDALGERGAAALMGVVSTLGLTAMGAITGPLGALLVLTRGALDGLWMPLLNIYINRRVGSDVRATTLSLMNVLSRLALSIALAVLGWALAEVGLTAALIGSGIAAAATAALLVATAPRRHAG